MGNARGYLEGAFVLVEGLACFGYVSSLSFISGLSGLTTLTCACMGVTGGSRDPCPSFDDDVIPKRLSTYNFKQKLVKTKESLKGLHSML